MSIVQFLLVIYAASVIDAASIALDQCELDRLFLMYGGGCSLDGQGMYNMLLQQIQTCYPSSSLLN